MTDNFVIHPNDVVDVVVGDLTPYINVEVAQPSPWGVVTVEGPQGPPGPVGPAGPSYSGVGWFFGEGPPTTVIGSKPGDYYMDLSDGTIYKLGD